MKLIVSNEREIVYCKPLAERVFSGAVAMLFVMMFVWVMPIARIFNKQLMMTAPDAIIGQILQARGRPATGTVVDRWRGKQNFLKVEYQANGKTYKINDKVTDVVYGQTPTGSRIRLLYLPDYPHTARTTVSNAAFYGRAMLGLWLALSLFAIIALPFAARYERKSKSATSSM